MTADDNHPVVACLSVAGCLWAGVGRLVWIWSMWVVQVDMDECFRLSVILINIVYIRSTYMCLIKLVFTNQDQAL